MIARIKKMLEGVLPSAIFGGSGAAAESVFLDLWKTRKQPSVDELLDGYKETAFSCANINARAVAATNYSLYVTTGLGQRSPAVRTRRVKAERVLAMRAHSSPAVSRKVALAETVEEVVEHPMLELLEHVNDLIDGYTLFELTDLYQEILGRAYWYVVLNEALGTPETLWVLPPQLVTHKRKDKVGELLYYEVGPDKDKLPPEQVLWFRFPSLRDPYNTGRSPLQAIYETAALVDEDTSYVAGTMANRMRPDVVYSPNEGIGEQEAKRLEKRIQRKFRRAGNGGWMILETPGKVTPLNYSPRDLEALARRKVSKVTIANAFDVPIAMLETESVNRANAEAALYQHARMGVRPRLKRIEQVINQGLVPMFDDRLFFAFDDPVPEDATRKAAIRKIDLASGHKLLNETRSEEGLDPVPWGDRPLMPKAMQPISSWEEMQAAGEVEREAARQAAEAAAAAQANAAPKEQEEEERKALQKAGDLYELFVRFRTGEVDRKAVVTYLVKAEEWPVHEALYATKREAPTEDKNLPHKAATWPKAARASMPDLAPLRIKLRNIFHRQLRYVFSRQKASALTAHLWGAKAAFDPVDLSSFDKELAKDARPVIQMWWDKKGKETLARLGVTNEEAEWNVHHPEIQTALDRWTFAFAESTNKTTSLELNTALSRLRTELTEGLISGDNTLASLTERVQGVFDKADKYRAGMIASTEGSRALHHAQELAAKKSGVVAGKAWILSDDACEICQAIARKYPKGVPLGTSFGETGGSAPYDQIPSPPAHPWCMCALGDILYEEGRTGPAGADVVYATDVWEPSYQPTQPAAPAPAVAPKPSAAPGKLTTGAWGKMSSTAQVEEALRGRMKKHGTKIDLGKMDVTLARELGKTVSEYSTAWEKMQKTEFSDSLFTRNKGALSKITYGQLSPGRQAQVTFDRFTKETTLTLNKMYWREGQGGRQFRKGLKRDQTIGWTTGGNPTDLLRHELGHVFDNNGGALSGSMRGYIKDNPPLVGQLSNYGMKNERETFAEAWSACWSQSAAKDNAWLAGFRSHTIKSFEGYDVPVPSKLAGGKKTRGVAAPRPAKPPSKRFGSTGEWDTWLKKKGLDDRIRGWSEGDNEEWRRMDLRGVAASVSAEDKTGYREFKEALSRAPRLAGAKALHRGLHISPKTYDASGFGDVGAKVTDKGTASWSGRQDMAKRFAYESRAPEDKAVVLSVKSKKGISIAEYSEYPNEQEYVQESGFSFRVTKVTEKTMEGTQYTFVEGEEL